MTPPAFCACAIPVGVAHFAAFRSHIPWHSECAVAHLTAFRSRRLRHSNCLIHRILTLAKCAILVTQSHCLRHSDCALGNLPVAQLRSLQHSDRALGDPAGHVVAQFAAFQARSRAACVILIAQFAAFRLPHPWDFHTSNANVLSFMHGCALSDQLHCGIPIAKSKRFCTANVSPLNLTLSEVGNHPEHW